MICIWILLEGFDKNTRLPLEGDDRIVWMPHSQDNIKARMTNSISHSVFSGPSVRNCLRSTPAKPTALNKITLSTSNVSHFQPFVPLVLGPDAKYVSVVGCWPSLSCWVLKQRDSSWCICCCASVELAIWDIWVGLVLAGMVCEVKHCRCLLCMTQGASMAFFILICLKGCLLPGGVLSVTMLVRGRRVNSNHFCIQCWSNLLMYCSFLAHVTNTYIQHMLTTIEQDKEEGTVDWNCIKIL